MSELAKAFFTFLILGALSIVLIQVGQVSDGFATTSTGESVFTRPLSFIQNTIALPHNILVASTANIRQYNSNISTKRNQQEVIEALEAEVASLRNGQRQLELQLEDYREILGVRVFQSAGAIGTADIVGVSSGAMQHSLTLSKGKSEGVLKFMPITVPEGLVGIVTDVQENKAIVRTILDPSSRVGITVQGKSGQGVAVGQLDGNLRVIDYFQEDQIKVGDLVETQSRKGLFPRGLPVGKVVQIIESDPNSLTLEFIVKPSADIQNLLTVSLIKPL